MILIANDRYIPLPAGSLSFLSVVNPDPQSLARETAMQRLSTGKFDMLTTTRQCEKGMPAYWTVRDDGRGEVWPVPDKPYEVRARDVLGKNPERAARQVATVFPVAEAVAAMGRAREEAERASERPRIEDFRRRASVTEEE